MKKYDFEFCMKFNCDECKNRRKCDGKKYKPKKKRGK